MPVGERGIVGFDTDTHHLLNPADSRQPSLVAEAVADDAVPLDRHLVSAGQSADAAARADA
ncbi:hypothetical protein [Streptomyces sp. SAS_272]|uniref:hypothetical protein n=1 Tax=Streptomyces sp. SAS_272 TaxID=3412747 RepID=UPI00403D2436